MAIVRSGRQAPSPHAGCGLQPPLPPLDSSGEESPVGTAVAVGVDKLNESLGTSFHAQHLRPSPLDPATAQGRVHAEAVAPALEPIEDAATEEISELCFRQPRVPTLPKAALLGTSLQNATEENVPQPPRSPLAAVLSLMTAIALVFASATTSLIAISWVQGPVAPGRGKPLLAAPLHAKHRMPGARAAEWRAGLSTASPLPWRPFLPGRSWAGAAGLRPPPSLPGSSLSKVLPSRAALVLRPLVEDHRRALRRALIPALCQGCVRRRKAGRGNNESESGNELSRAWDT